MIQELTAQQEDIMLEQGLELWRERRYKEEHKKKCYFCGGLFDEEEIRKATIDEGERIELCEGCYNELTEFEGYENG